jgi:hypothetical protein
MTQIRIFSHTWGNSDTRDHTLVNDPMMKERRNAMVERRKYEDREDTYDERQESVNISGSPN